MEAKARDPAEFRQGQRDQWDTAATGWRKWSELIDSVASAISERLVELAEVKPGSRVIDMAAGYGEPTLSAAKVAGPDGKVVATDISAEMLAYGRERAEAAGLENIEFVEADASALDFPEDSFDAALSRFGIIFEPDGEGAAARVRGFLSRVRRWRSPPGARPIEVRSSGFPCAPLCRRLTSRRRHPGPPVRSPDRRRRRSAACSRAAASRR